MPKFKEVAPAFAARDFAKLATFYEKVLGFKSQYKTENYCVLKRDDISLHIYPQRDDKVGGHNSAYFFVTGVDELFKAVAKKAKIVHPISDQPYGLRDFLMQDPEGNNIGIAQRLDTLPKTKRKT